MRFFAVLALLLGAYTASAAEFVALDLDSVGRELGELSSEAGSGPPSPSFPPLPQSPFSPPGAPGAPSFVEYSSVSTMIASGSTTDFTKAVKNAIAEKFAAAAGVPRENVTLTVVSASVLITAKVVVGNATAAASTTTTLKSELSTTAAATAFLSTPALNVTVVSTPVVDTVSENVVAYPPPPPPPDDDKLSGGAIAGIVIGSLLGAALVAYLAVTFVMKKGNPLAASTKDEEVTFAVVDNRAQENV